MKDNVVKESNVSEIDLWISVIVKNSQKDFNMDTRCQIPIPQFTKIGEETKLVICSWGEKPKYIIFLSKME